jgi:hypothetical protein
MLVAVLLEQNSILHQELGLAGHSIQALIEHPFESSCSADGGHNVVLEIQVWL